MQFGRLPSARRKSGPNGCPTNNRPSKQCSTRGSGSKSLDGGKPAIVRKTGRSSKRSKQGAPAFLIAGMKANGQKGDGGSTTVEIFGHRTRYCFEQPSNRRHHDRPPRAARAGGTDPPVSAREIQRCGNRP